MNAFMRVTPKSRQRVLTQGQSLTQMSKADYDTCEANLSVNETTQALLSMSLGSSPGSDGRPVEFL